MDLIVLGCFVAESAYTGAGLTGEARCRSFAEKYSWLLKVSCALGVWGDLAVTAGIAARVHHFLTAVWWTADCADLAAGLTLDASILHPALAAQHYRLDTAWHPMSSVLEGIPWTVSAPLHAAGLHAVPHLPQVTMASASH